MPDKDSMTIPFIMALVVSLVIFGAVILNGTSAQKSTPEFHLEEKDTCVIGSYTVDTEDGTKWIRLTYENDSKQLIPSGIQITNGIDILSAKIISNLEYWYQIPVDSSGWTVYKN